MSILYRFRYTKKYYRYMEKYKEVTYCNSEHADFGVFAAIHLYTKFKVPSFAALMLRREPQN